MTKVRCTVDNCVYWGSGDVCKAEAIWINSNMSDESIGQSSFYDLEFAVEGPEPSVSESGADSSSATSSRHTCCDTMRPKDHEHSSGHCPHCK